MKKSKQQLAFFEGGEKAKAEIIKGAALTPEAERLLGNFEVLAEAPDGIKRLRQLILELAVRGKLVPQDIKCGSAMEVLERVEAKRQRLYAEAKTGRVDPLLEIDLASTPFEVPSGWIWTRFGSATICRDAQRIPVSKELREGRRGSYDYYGASGVIDHVDAYLFDESLLLIGEDGANLINRATPIAFIAHGKYWVNNHAHVLDADSLDALRYLAVFVNAIDLKPYVTGTAQPKLNQARMNAILVAIPPLAEQARIVAKVDEFMALCDEMETRQAKRRVVAGRLNKAALGELTTAEGPEEFAASLQRVLGNLEAFTDEPGGVQALRNTLLRLAMQGSLVKTSTQLPQERKRASHQTTVGDFVDFLNGYAFKSEWFADSGVRLLRNVNVSHGDMRWSDVVYVSPERAKEFKRFELAEGDIVISLDRPIIATGVKVARVSATDLPCLVLQRVAKVVFKGNSMEAEFFFAWLTSPMFTEAIDPGRSKGVPHISTREIGRIPIVLPTPHEQKSTMQRLRRLMALCDSLEAKLRAADEGARRLTESLVAELIA